MTAEENNQRKLEFETNSQRYGNTTAIEDVYDDLSHPQPSELEEALATTDFLTRKESLAFAFGHFGSVPEVLHQIDKPEELLQCRGFETISEFKSVRQTAREKIADAIWIYELIDAYRFPDISPPEKCDECGDPPGQPWVTDHSQEGSTVQCMDCADIDPDSQRYPYESTSDNE